MGANSSGESTKAGQADFVSLFGIVPGQSWQTPRGAPCSAPSLDSEITPNRTGTLTLPFWRCSEVPHTPSDGRLRFKIGRCHPVQSRVYEFAAYSNDARDRRGDTVSLQPDFAKGAGRRVAEPDKEETECHRCAERPRLASFSLQEIGVNDFFQPRPKPSGKDQNVKGFGGAVVELRIQAVGTRDRRSYADVA